MCCGYQQLSNVPDRLRWLRKDRGLLQSEAASAIGISVHAYKNLEEGVTGQIPRQIRESLAQFYGVAAEEFQDEYTRFLEDGQATRIRALRAKLGLDRRGFAERRGIPLRSLEVWENEKKTVSYKSWERYFKGME